MRQHFRKIAGFALLEASLALCVLSVVTAGSVAWMRAHLAATRVEKTQRAFDVAMRALACFAEVQGRLPRPTVDASGREDAHESRCVGLLPYATLCLDVSSVTHGFGQVLAYVVNPDLTFPPTTSALDDLLPEGTPTGLAAIRNRHFLRLVDDKGSPLLQETETDFCALVIISSPSLKELQRYIQVDGPRVVVTIPSEPSRVRMRWISRNNLLAYLRR